MLKASLAVVAGMALSSAVLVVPGAAAPASGRATAWGWNARGQLGDNTVADSAVPVNIMGVLASKTVTALAVGDEHSCAVVAGQIYCWGRNGHGQLGNNSTTDSSAPAPVDTNGVLAGKTVTTITAGETHSCGVAEGRAYCWGSNSAGQLGNDSVVDSAVPVAVETSGVLAGKAVTAITAGYRHSCAVADGKAYCWGSDSYGQLGNDAGIPSRVPFPVSTAGPLGGRTVSAITAGAFHSCAVAGGKAFCWGSNIYGELGDNGTTGSKVPVAVDTTGPLAGRTVTGVSAKLYHSCAVAEARVSCWGYNLHGQLGNNNTSDSRAPVAVNTDGALAGRTVTQVAAGANHSCAVADGRAYCWGYNGFGQLGNHSTTGSTVPVAVDMTGPLAGKTVTAISSGVGHTAALAAAVPQPPTGVAGTAADGQVTVSWNPPTDDGGSPVLEYVATAIPGGSSCTTTGTSCVVTGLSNGAGYTFTVTARNAIGVSAASLPSAPVTPMGTTPPVQPPGKVGGIKAKVSKGKVKVTWKAVAGASSYRVRISKPGGKTYQAWKSTTKRVFKAEVRKGKKYRVQVAAAGPGGRGPVSTIRFKGK
jgi:alpha-tubulin suppressor-like RCC1 family protein